MKIQRDQIQEVITDLIHEMGFSSIHETMDEKANFSEFGLDSLDLMDLAIHTEDAFSIEIINEEIQSAQTLESLSNLVFEKLQDVV